jgi:hypothetical protein
MEFFYFITLRKFWLKMFSELLLNQFYYVSQISI